MAVVTVEAAVQPACACACGVFAATVRLTIGSIPASLPICYRGLSGLGRDVLLV